MSVQDGLVNYAKNDIRRCGLWLDFH